MPEHPSMTQPGFRAAFLANEQQERVYTGKIGSALVVLLMPTGIVMDRCRLSRRLGYAHVAAPGILSAGPGALVPAYDRLWTKALSVPWVADCPGARVLYRLYDLCRVGPHACLLGSSPYYAGLNLVLLAVSVVVHWSVRESLLAVGQCARYVLAAICLAKHSPEARADHLQQLLFPRTDRDHGHHRQLLLQPAALPRIRPALRAGPQQEDAGGEQPEADGTGPDQEPLLRQHQP